MSNDEFKNYYQVNSGLTDDEMRYFMTTQVIVKCECGEPGCQGWAMVSKTNVSKDVLGKLIIR